MQKRSINYAKNDCCDDRSGIVFYFFLRLETYQSLIKSSFNKMQFQILEFFLFFLTQCGIG